MCRSTGMFIAGLVLLGISAAEAIQNLPGNPQRPNVVLIITDDVGYGDIGSYGASDIMTPNIDRLAKEGVKLTDFYAAPQCTPTRAALITGRYQQRVQLERALGNAGTVLEQGLSPTGRSLPQLLKNNEYATGLIGKWHLGYKPEFGPNAHGFDYFFGFLSGFIDFYTHTRGDGMHDLFENTTPVHENGYMTDLITAKAVRFIEQQAAKPFFLEVAYNAAHWPFQPPDHFSRAPTMPPSRVLRTLCQRLGKTMWPCSKELMRVSVRFYASWTCLDFPGTRWSFSRTTMVGSGCRGMRHSFTVRTRFGRVESEFPQFCGGLDDFPQANPADSWVLRWT